MRKALFNDKETVITILVNAFDANKSINYIIPADRKRCKRLRELMAYSFELCMLFGEVYLTEDQKACAWVLLLDRRKQHLKTIWLAIKLAFLAIGLSNIRKVMKREATVKKVQMSGPVYYLWFIGVQPSFQGNGTGSRLLETLLKRADELGRLVCLETSTVRNLPWYEKNGFEIYHQLDLGYSLYFMKRMV